MMNMPYVLKLIVAAFFLAILPAQVHALTPDRVFDKVKDSIVAVRILDAQGKVKGQGSGVLLPLGKIATNCHVVEGGASYQVGRGKQRIRATLYAEDGDKDICLLDAMGIKGKPALLGNAAGLKAGDAVYAVGAPRGRKLSLSEGIVAQRRGGTPLLIRTTAAVPPGASGGGLFDGEGRLVGLITFSPEGEQNLTLAIPVEWIGEVKPGRKQAAGGRSQDDWKKHSFSLEQSDDLQGLLDWCRKWTKSEPEDAAAWIRLGYACSKLNRYDEAVEAYRQAVRITPEHAETWYGLGAAYDELKRYDDAIGAYRQATLIDPEDARVWLSLGFVYGILKRYDDAIYANRQVVRIDPENASAWTILVHTYIISGNRTAALEAIQQLRRLDQAKAENLFKWFGPW
jgi:tetratricopeptide (TPR) repeat protein